MSSPYDVEIVRLLDLAAAARARASAEERRAIRAAGLAVGGSEVLRATHQSIAELHRRNAGMHRATARLYERLAERRRLLATGAGRGEHHSMAGAAAAAVGAPSLVVTALTADGVLADLGTTDSTSEAAHDLEFAFGEGPLHDAMAKGEVVVAGAEAIESRWPLFAGPLGRLGVRGVVAAPLRRTVGPFGAVAVYGAELGLPSGDALQRVSDLLVQELLRELRGEAEDDLFGSTGAGRTHQAVGMVTAQLGCGAEAAMDLIRARAFADGVPNTTVAGRIIAGELRLEW